MNRRLAAILAADVVGYSTLMAADEAGTLAALREHRQTLFDPETTKRGGRIVKLMGDGTLVEFASVVDAVEAALAIQQAQAEAGGPIRLRIGINLGDVIIDGDDIYGDGVNIAARLEALSAPGGICISSIVHESLGQRIEATFHDAGEQQVKNIARPVRVFHWQPDGADKPAAAADSPVPTAKPAIAVLAFDNMSGDPEQEYLSDGISEDIITALSRFPELFVIARNSSFAYKGTSTRVDEIGRDLNVAYVVEGSVRKAGSRIRITAQLVEAATGNHIWAERYDRELDDIFDLQDEITHAIATVLPLRLQVARLESARQKPSDNLTAYDCFLRARWLYNRTNERVPEVLKLLDRAIDIDPACAHAHAFTAFVHGYSIFSFAPLADDPTIAARTSIELALHLADTDHQIQTIAAQVYIMAGENELATRHINKALALNPNDFRARVTAGSIKAYGGEGQKGFDMIASAMSHDPLVPSSELEDLAEAAYMAHDYEAAIDVYKRWQNPPVHMYTHLAACYAQLDRPGEARAAVAIFETGRPPNSDFTYYATAHARMCKHREDAEHWLEGYRKAGLIG